MVSYNPDAYRTFHKRGQGYTSNTLDTFNKSPVYIIASTAMKLIESGRTVKLPEDYDAETLRRIMYITGFRERDVHISHRQADEMVAIGRELLEHFQGELTSAERSSVEWLLRIVQ